MPETRTMGGVHGYLCLVVVLLAAHAQAQNTSIRATNSTSIATKPLRTVCTADYSPVTTCADVPEPTGYEVELFKKAVDRLYRSGNLEWAPGNWKWNCWASWSDMLLDLLKNETQRTCDVVVAGVSATTERKAKGMQFSYPTLASGRLIMVYMNINHGMWSFFEPFETSLWLACFATSMGMGLLLLLSETPWASLAWQGPRPALTRLAGLQWGALALLLRAAGYVSPRSIGGRLMLAGYLFMAFILANMYVSSMTALLSQRARPSSIVGMDDLVNTPVGLFVDDVPAFQRFALQDVHAFPWATDEDERAMLTALRDGTVQALILDSPWVRYTAAANCEFFVVDQPVLPVNLGFAFPADTPASYLALFDSSLSHLDDQGELAALGHVWLQPATPCHAPKGDPRELISPTVRLKSVTGLWVILGACIAVCLLWNIIAWMMQCMQTRYTHPSGQVAKGATGFLPGVGQKVSAKCAALVPSRGLGGSTGSTGQPVSYDEALQEIQSQIREMDLLVRHLPFVMTASLDARLAELRAHLQLTAIPGVPPQASMTETEGLSSSSRNVTNSATASLMQTQPNGQLGPQLGTVGSMEGRSSSQSGHNCNNGNGVGSLQQSPSNVMEQGRAAPAPPDGISNNLLLQPHSSGHGVHGRSEGENPAGGMLIPANGTHGRGNNTGDGLGPRGQYATMQRVGISAPLPHTDQATQQSPITHLAPSSQQHQPQTASQQQRQSTSIA